MHYIVREFRTQARRTTCIAHRRKVSDGSVRRIDSRACEGTCAWEVEAVNARAEPLASAAPLQPPPLHHFLITRARLAVVKGVRCVDSNPTFHHLIDMSDVNVCSTVSTRIDRRGHAPASMRFLRRFLCSLASSFNEGMGRSYSSAAASTSCAVGRDRVAISAYALARAKTCCTTGTPNVSSEVESLTIDWPTHMQPLRILTVLMLASPHAQIPLPSPFLR